VDDLKALRQQKRLTQKRLAAWVGVDPATLRSWEYGTVQPRPEHILRLTEALGLDAEQLPAMLRAAAAEKRRHVLAMLRV
jgi:transcriptional regulator with XRE-family HTH domain